MKLHLPIPFPHGKTTFKRVEQGETFVLDGGQRIYLKLEAPGDYACLSSGELYHIENADPKVTIVALTATAEVSARNALSYDEFLDKEGLTQW